MKATTATSQLKDLAKLDVCPACVAIIAADRIRRDRALSFVLDRFAPPGLKPQSFAFSDQSRASLASFLADAASPSLFEPVRYVVVRNIENARAADVEPLARLLENHPAGVHVFVLGSSLPNVPTFKKSLSKHATLLEFEQLKGAELRRWTERELRQAGIESASDPIVEMIISLGSESVEQISSIIEKYALYLDGTPAEIETLQRMFPGRSHASDFELAESLLLGKRGSTEVLIAQLLSQGSSPFMLIGLLSKTLTTVLRIRALSDRGFQQQDIRSDLGLSPWLFNKYLPLAKRFTVAAIAHHLDALSRADFRLKDRSLGADTIFSSLTHEMSRHG